MRWDIVLTLIYLDDNLMRKVAQWLDNDLIAKELNISMSHGFLATTRSIDDSIAYKKANNIMV